MPGIFCPGCLFVRTECGDLCKRCLESGRSNIGDPVWNAAGLPDQVTLEDVTQKTVRMLNRQAELLEREITRINPDGVVATQFHAQHLNQLGKLSRALSMILREARALEKETREAVDKMSHEDKAKLFVEWFGTTPPELQRKVQQDITKALNEARKSSKAG